MRNYIINWIKQFYGVDKTEGIQVLVENADFQSHKYLWAIFLFISTVVLSLIIWWVTKEVILSFVNSFAKRTKTKFDDLLVKNKFFTSE